MLERFKTRVYYKAHYWLVLHYWCFIMDNACENQRRRPFLREAILGRCDSQLVSRKFLRSRTEMETCLGQRDREDGYMVRSKYFPFKWTNWCRGDVILGHPTNYPPFTLVRKGNCPLVPPTPRWANAHSWCLPKPISKTLLECPKEEFPEYEWNWDWQKFIQDHHWEKGQFSAVTENQIFSIYYININPTSEIWSSYPWVYDVHDFTPRTTPYMLAADSSTDDNSMYKSVETLLSYLQKYKGDMLPVRNGPCYEGLCNYVPGYLEYPLYPVNRVYIRTQAPFLQEIGWAFWDTEDDTDDRPMSEMQVAIDPTPTHMPVAEHWKLEENWDVPCTPGDGVDCDVCCKFNQEDKNRGGKSSKHAVIGEHDKKYRLWDPPPMASFKTGGTRMQYCCTTISEKQDDKHWHDLHWPDGHLCIYGHGAIDSVIYEFRQGSIGWDCENGRIQDEKRYGNKIYSDSANDMFANWDDVATQQRLTHSLPTGLYHIQYDGLSNQFFSQNVLCMDAITDPEHRVELPRDRPFYLMQKKGTCQRVVGMFHTRVSLKWHTETRHMTQWVETPTYENAFVPLEMNSWGRAQAFGRRDTIPDGHYGQDYIQIWYCFYQPNVIYYRREAGETAPGLEPYYFIDMSLNPLEKDDGGPSDRKLLRENAKDEVFFYDVVIMDKNGVYNVYWDNNPTTLCPRV